MKRAKLFMDTVVTIQVVTDQSEEAAEAAISQAFEAFRSVEDSCSRFSPDSELMRLCRQPGVAVPVSPYLFEPLKFALEMARWTDGLFDPTVGKAMERHGFNVHYLTGEPVESPATDSATFRDIVLNEPDRTVLLRMPLVIDLGAVAKGFAIDLAAHCLREFTGFVVNAGGDLFAGGVQEDGKPWSVGIRHPLRKDRIICKLELSNEAVCTSGSYERQSPKQDGIHHLLHPRTNRSPHDWISCSVAAPYAMMADAFSTAAFLAGESGAQALIEQAGLRGILIAADGCLVKAGEME